MESKVHETVQNEDLAEEIDAINAIYEPTTIVFTDSILHPNIAAEYTIILKIPNHTNLSFLIGLESTYPSTPPRVLGPASTGSRGEGKKWTEILAESAKRVWTEGSVCLYDLIVDAEEQFNEVKAAGDKAENDVAISQEVTPTADHDRSETKSSPPKTLSAPPPWVISDPITEKKSIFVARAAITQSKEQAEAYLNHLLATEKKVASATHNITAWRIRQRQRSAGEEQQPGHETIIQDFDDDGETAAGGRLLHLMQLMDVWDVVVVVTRWYGGVKLGPDRFRIINAAARDALVKGGFGTTNQPLEKGKKKGKK